MPAPSKTLKTSTNSLTKPKSAATTKASSISSKIQKSSSSKTSQSILVKSAKQVVKSKDTLSSDKENQPVVSNAKPTDGSVKNFGGIPFIRSKKHTATKEFKLSGTKNK